MTIPPNASDNGSGAGPGENSDAASASSAEAYCPSCDTSYPHGSGTCPRDGARLIQFAPEDDRLIGRTLDGRYEIRTRLGQGAMGVVYRAWQASVDREVALKVVDRRLLHDRAAAKRFLREARLASRLSQPSVVAVHDFGQTEDGILYLVMELLQGRTLADILRASQVLTARRAARIGVQLCDALEAAHRLDIIHRDLKPANILVLDEPRDRDLIKVLDFGLAKSLTGEVAESTVTHSQKVLGTPVYMSPEAIRGQSVDGRGDLYATGVILYELLAGRPPFSAGTVNAICAQHLNQMPEPLPANVPQRLAQLVMMLLEKDPDRRPPDAGAVRRVLVTVTDELAAAQQVTRRPVPDASSDARPMSADSKPTVGLSGRAAVESSRDNGPTSAHGGPPRVAAAGLVLLVLAAGGAWWYLATSRSGEPATPPAAERQLERELTAPAAADEPPATVDAAVNTGGQAATARDPTVRAASASQIDAGVARAAERSEPGRRHRTDRHRRGSTGTAASDRANPSTDTEPAAPPVRETPRPLAPRPDAGPERPRLDFTMPD